MSSLELSEITVERGGRPVVKDVSISVPATRQSHRAAPARTGRGQVVPGPGRRRGPSRRARGRSRLTALELAGRRPEKIRAAGRGDRAPRAVSSPAARPLGRRQPSRWRRLHAVQAGGGRGARPRPRAVPAGSVASGLTVQARLLSGGEQQMVVLAQALVSQPKYILIDELSLGLAPVIVNQLIPVIRALQSFPASACCSSSSSPPWRCQLATSTAHVDGGRRPALLGHRHRAQGASLTSCTPPTCCAARPSPMALLPTSRLPRRRSRLYPAQERRHSGALARPRPARKAIAESAGRPTAGDGGGLNGLHLGESLGSGANHRWRRRGASSGAGWTAADAGGRGGSRGAAVLTVSIAACGGRGGDPGLASAAGAGSVRGVVDRGGDLRGGGGRRVVAGRAIGGRNVDRRVIARWDAGS